MPVTKLEASLADLEASGVGEALASLRALASGQRAKAKAQARAAAAEEFFTRDVRTPEPLQGRQNIDI